MPLTYLAAQTSLQWADYVAEVGLFTRLGEVTGGLYARQPVTFSPVNNGSRLSQQVLTFNLTGNVTVYLYGLYDDAGNRMAIIPHCSSADTNPPMPCFFIDTVTGWIDAPGHTLEAGQHILLMSGQEAQTNSFLDAQFNPLAAGGITYSTLPAYMAQQYNSFYVWYVAAVDTDRFQIMLYDDYPYGTFISGGFGWGFYQRVDYAVFPGGGTLQINSIRLTEFG